MELDESKLIKKAQKGNVKAFEKLIIFHEKNIYNLAYRYMGNYDDAADLAQEALIRIYKSINSFRGDSSFKTWIYQIVSNVCRDELRKRKRKTCLSLDNPVITEDGEFKRETEDQSFDPEILYEKKEIQEYVHNLIEGLSLEYKEIIILREIQGFSYEEIANILDCSLGTVKSRLNRARNSLKKIISLEQEPIKEEFRLSNIR